MGNRDLNKLRFKSELSDFDMQRDIDDIPKPFWDKNAKSLKEHLLEVIEEKGSVFELVDVNTRAERLRYML